MKANKYGLNFAYLWLTTHTSVSHMADLRNVHDVRLILT